MNAMLSVTFTAKDYSELVKQAQLFGRTQDATTTRAPKKTKPVEEPGEQLDLMGTDETEVTEETGELSFDDPEEAEQEVREKTAKTAKKYTDKDVNQAAMAHAKANGSKAKTLKILEKKFGVKSILELKPAQYGQVIAALKV